MYRHVLILCASAVAVLSASTVVRAADIQRCQQLGKQLRLEGPKVSATEVSLALFSAADENCTGLATELLDGGASADARDRFGARPLSHAARNGRLEMVELLLARGAPINARNLAGATALYYAAERGHVAVVQKLIAQGADVKLTGRSGLSPVAAGAYAGNDTIVDILIAHGADERAPDETGKPPIVYAAARAKLDVVRRLLTRDVDVNARYVHDLTLLMWAAGADEKVAESDALKVVTYLLDAGAHVDDRDARGRTALMIAAEGGRSEIATLLISRGADASLRDRGGKAAADLTTVSSLRERLTAQ